MLSSKDVLVRTNAVLDFRIGTASKADLWESAPFQKIIGAQLPDGSWGYKGGRPQLRSSEDYAQLETFRMLRLLVEEFRLGRGDPTFDRAAEFVLSHQTEEGDIRGIAGNQYVPYYTAAFFELLSKGGLTGDRRIAKGMDWLLSVRQEDGGWAFPIRTAGLKLGPSTFKGKTVAPDRSKPFSHLVTGVVLRAFAAHPTYRSAPEAQVAGRLMVGRLFKADPYPDRGAPEFWTSFSFPFWFNDLLSALDSLSLLGFRPEQPDIKRALRWFRARQRRDGFWRLRLRAMAREPDPDGWITLGVSRLFKRFYD